MTTNHRNLGGSRHASVSTINVLVSERHIFNDSYMLAPPYANGTS